jgi:hypothetical protein
MVAVMGFITLLMMAMGMLISLGQFQEVPAAELVRLSQAIGREFNAENVGVKVRMHSTTTAFVVTYSSLVDSKYDLSLQNKEMEDVANYAIRNFRGREQSALDQIEVTRTETHGRGCFSQSYVSHFTLANPMKRAIFRPGMPAVPPPGVPPEPPRNP